MLVTHIFSFRHPQQLLENVRKNGRLSLFTAKSNMTVSSNFPSVKKNPKFNDVQLYVIY